MADQLDQLMELLAGLQQGAAPNPAPYATAGAPTGRHGLALEQAPPPVMGPEVANSPWGGVDPVVATPPPPPPPRTGWLGMEMGAKSDLGMQLARAGLGIGAGLMSTQPGKESGFQGLARGVTHGTSEFLAEGRRQRAQKARDRFGALAEQGGPGSDVYALMAAMEPAGAAGLLASTIRSDSVRDPYAVADYRAGLTRETQRIGRRDARELRGSDPYEVERQTIARYRMAKHDQNVRDGLVEEGVIPEEMRYGTTLPVELEDAISEYNKRSPGQMFQGAIDRDVLESFRGGGGGSYEPPAGVE